MSKVKSMLSPRVQTAINSAAIGLLIYGASALKEANYVAGSICIAVGIGLEFVKYHFARL